MYRAVFAALLSTLLVVLVTAAEEGEDETAAAASPPVAASPPPSLPPPPRLPDPDAASSLDDDPKYFNMESRSLDFWDGEDWGLVIGAPCAHAACQLASSHPSATRLRAGLVILVLCCVCGCCGVCFYKTRRAKALPAPKRPPHYNRRQSSSNYA